MNRTTRDNELELARQGNPAAIAALLNRSLRHRGIIATAQREGSTLHLTLESARILSQPALVAVIEQGFSQLGVTGIRTIDLAAQRTGNPGILWQHIIPIDPVDMARDSVDDAPLIERVSRPSLQATPADDADSMAPEEESDMSVTNRPVVVTTPPGEVVVNPRYRSPQDAAPAGTQDWTLIVGDRRLLPTPHGIQVRPLTSGNRPMMIPRPAPTADQFCQPVTWLNRNREIDLATRFLQSTSPVELYGEAGLGKTTILRAIAHDPSVTALFPDGVVYWRVRQLPLSDLTQALFQTFMQYEEGAARQPTEADIRYALRGKQALVLLDDVDWTHDDLNGLSSILPSLTVLATASDRHLWGENQAIPLAGLPLADSMALIQQGLGRSLVSDEQYLAEALCRRLQGHPLRLLQMSALVRERQASFASLVEWLRIWTAEELMLRFAANLAEPERRLLAVLTLADGLPVPLHHLAPLIALPDVTPLVQRLEQLSLILAETGGYSLARNLIQPIRRAWSLEQWLQRVTTYMMRWADQQPPDAVLAIAPLLLHLLEQTSAQEQWNDVLHLSQVLESPLALYGQWATWQTVLQYGLQAAEQLADQRAIAWVRHQLGTRYLVLGLEETAEAELLQALQLREALGDDAGATVTRQNLAGLSRSHTTLVTEAEVAEPQAVSTLTIPWRRWAVPAAIALGGLVALLALWRPSPTPVEVEISLSQDNTDFGGQLVHTTTNPETIELQNNGTAPLSIAKLSLAGDHAPDFQVSDNCTTRPLPPGEDCEIVVSFTPQAVGNRTAELQLTDASGRTHPLVTLQGRGTPAYGPLMLEFAPGSVVFNEQQVGDRSPIQAITVKNTGREAIQLRAVSPLGEHKDDFWSRNTCTEAVLAPGQTCQIEVAFQPTSPGNRVASLVIGGDAATDGPQAQQLWNIALSGRGVSTPVAPGGSGANGGPGPRPGLPGGPSEPPEGMGNGAAIELSGDRLVYGEVAVGQSSTVQSVIVANTGNAALQFGDIRVVSNQASPFTITEDSCGRELAANWECRISIQFAPQVPGDFQSTLVIPHSAAGGSLAVGLFGTGLRGGEAQGRSPQIVDLSITPATLRSGETAQLCYRISGAERASISGFGDLNPVNEGCLTIQPTQTTTYTLVAVSSTGEQVSQQVSVQVRADDLQTPTVLGPGRLEAQEPEALVCRNGATLQWQSTGSRQYGVTLQRYDQSGWTTAVNLISPQPTLSVTSWLWESYASAWRWQVYSLNESDRSAPSPWHYITCTDVP